ncbi:MAG: MYXO-CTERM sorting domain-containing protein [Polyangiaceae bacterium]
MRTLRPLTALVALASGLLLTTSADAQQLRYSGTRPGGIAATGNTLGLSKAFNNNSPGVEDSIGTFLSLSSASVDNMPVGLSPWPNGTTWDWTQNGSMAMLDLPDGAQVLYAELVWAGSYNYIEDVSAYLDTAVTLGAGSNEIQVTPANTTAQTFAETSYTGFAVNYYIRSANVTNFVIQNGAGAYDVSGVPATQSESINSLNAAGWTLVVAYRSDAEPIRNLSIFVGGSFVDEDSQQDYLVSGFCAPPFGPVEGNVVVAALEGDADLVGDTLQIAETDLGPFATLGGPNNPTNNFFASQINGKNGLVDTSGSFGMANHDAFNGVNVSGGRQGWDLTRVPLSDQDGQLTNSQTSAVVRTITTGDSYVPSVVALELDVKSPDFSNSSTDASVDVAQIGDAFTLTATLSNTGEAQANNLTFSMPIPQGLDLVSYATDGSAGDVSGFPVTPTNVTQGVDAGVLDVNQTRTITMEFKVTGPPMGGNTFDFTPMWGHDFITCDTDPPLTESFTPPTESVAYDEPVMGTGGMGGMGAGGMGGMGAAGGMGGSPPDDEEIIQEDGGCGCTTPGSRDDREAGWLLLGVLGMGVGLRRRRLS